MPTYDYRCKACGHEMEAFQGIKDATLRRCPMCKRNRLERLIGGGAGIIFKGPGFYGTDYKKGGSSKPAAGGSGEASEGEKKPKPDATGSDD